MDTQKIQSTLEFKAFMQDLMTKPADEINDISDETFQKFLEFCKELIDDFDYPFSFYYAYPSLLSENEIEKDFWVNLVELEADMKCRIYPGTKFDLPYSGMLKHAAEHDRKTFLLNLLSACGKTGKFKFSLLTNIKDEFPSENIVQWTSLMKLIRKLGIG